MFGWLRRRRGAPDIPDALWQGALAAYPFLASRTHTELLRLRELAAGFLRDKQFHGAHGLVVTDEMAMAIAAQAVLPVLNLGLHWYDDFVGIVVHPAQALARRTWTDEAGVVHQYDEVLAGEAMDRGPVMLSWEDVQQAGSDTGLRGSAYNVVIHEFCHKIDMRNGEADGCPPLRSVAARRAWRRTMDAEYRRFRELAIMADRFGGPPTWLDTYAAVSIGEFFAVACEGYFVDRERFAAEHAALLPLFDGFFTPGRSGAQ